MTLHSVLEVLILHMLHIDLHIEGDTVLTELWLYTYGYTVVDMPI